MISQMLLGGGAGGMTLIGAIRSCALTANLQLCVDSGDANSYTSGTKWLDQSGGGYDFFLGADGSAGAPTFTGTAGHLDAYWDFNGSQFFRYDSANETWMTNIHKDNAAYTIISILYVNSITPTNRVCGDAAGAETGFSFTTIATTGKPRIFVTNAGATVLLKDGDTALGAGSYHFMGVSISEPTGAGGGFIYSDGNYNQVSGANTFDATYSSPSSGAASNTMALAANSSGTAMPAGAKMACVAIWSSALTKANLDSIWALMRGRFGI